MTRSKPISFYTDEAGRVRPITKGKDSSAASPKRQPSDVILQAWFKKRNYTPIAVGKKFKPYEGCTYSVQYPYDTSDRFIGMLIKNIEEGEDNRALVYDEKEYAYKILQLD